MISGSYPPQQLCGVGDYTEKLVVSLRSQNIDVEVLANIDWSLSQLNSICKRIKEIKADIIHIQFPSIGYKYSFLPQALSLRYKTIITIHEASQFHPLRKLWLLPFSFNKNLIFTSLFEYKYFKSIFPWYQRKPNVIPIGSNITGPFNFPVSFNGKNTDEIIYFGLIRPKKGLEQVIELATLLKQGQLNYKIKIIGKIIDKDLNYFYKLKQSTENLPICWLTNFSEKEVFDQLSKSAIAYLPYPDGASERRGSLLAVIKNGLMVYTTQGPQTAPEFAEMVTFVNNPKELVNMLARSEMEKVKTKFSEKSINMQSFIKKFEWSEIAKTHLLFYKNFMEK